MPAAGQPAELDPGPSSHLGPRLKDGETEHSHEFDRVSLFPDAALSQHDAEWGLLSQGSQAWWACWDTMPSRAQSIPQLKAARSVVHCSDSCRGGYTAPEGRHGQGVSPACPDLPEKGSQGSPNPCSIWKGHGVHRATWW